MEMKLLNEDEKKKHYNDLLRLMEKSDNDFVPPLSKRSSTTQANLSGENGGSGSISAYLNEMLKQQILACVENDVLLGFVSFKENYVSDILGEENLPNIYLSTLILDEQARGKGLTRKMYAHLFDELYRGQNVFTRTWSTNIAHIKILNGFGFDELCRIKNDRGNGIDTVYYGRKNS